ncbi:MAG: uroporphyrinogen-III C-methyltransferase [Streptosporangiales bacterium]
MYPLFLDVTGKRVLVVGGGTVAARRAGALADAGADVVVVAPTVCGQLAADGRLRRMPRPYESPDLEGAWLVHTATGDRVVDAQVAADAEAARVWCVRADDAAASAAWTPATARVDDVTVAVSAGGDPRRGVAVRDAVALELECGALPVRARRRRPYGHVTLVGGGPGDPGLITTRGRRALADADVVVVDRLAPRELLAELDDDVELVEAGKAPGAHALAQQQINALLVDRARAGRHVVRLKGGDPFVFGRGGEEVAACRETGVAVTVIPGVTSAFAGPAAAGIPVTQRGLSRGVTVVSAHDELGWATLARLDGTLVLLMGVHRLDDSASALLAHGMDPDTPVAVVERAHLPGQRTTRATLATVGAVARVRELRNPAVIVVGAVAALADGGSPVVSWAVGGSPVGLATA